MLNLTVVGSKSILTGVTTHVTLPTFTVYPLGIMYKLPPKVYAVFPPITIGNQLLPAVYVALYTVFGKNSSVKTKKS